MIFQDDWSHLAAGVLRMGQWENGDRMGRDHQNYQPQPEFGCENGVKKPQGNLNKAIVNIYKYIIYLGCYFQTKPYGQWTIQNIGIQEVTWVNQQALEISRDGLAQMIEMGGYRRVIERTCKNLYFTELDDGTIYRTAL